MRRGFSYANVAATLALVFSMSGGALAASHYLVTSTKQIKPSVLKKLKGNAGKLGPTGKEGPAGKEGKEGSQGKEGPAGLSALATLPSGESESGVFAFGGTEVGKDAYVEEAITFPIPLTARIPVSNVIYNEPGATTAACSGPGHAAKGFLCLYATESEHVELLDAYNAEERSGAPNGAGRLGADLDWEASEALSYSDGTYTVTSP